MAKHAAQDPAATESMDQIGKELDEYFRGDVTLFSVMNRICFIRSEYELSK